MKAGIYLGKESIEIREVDLPEVGDNDVLVQNLYSSICGTDVAVFTHGPNTGHKVTVGGEFGHETISRIVKVGKNVTEFVPGGTGLSLSPLCKKRYQTCGNNRRLFRVYLNP